MAKQRGAGKSGGTSESRPSTVALLPARDIVPLPGLVLPVHLPKGQGTDAVAYAINHGHYLVLSIQQGFPEEIPTRKNLARVGAIAKVVASTKLPNGDIRARFHVQSRVSIRSFVSDKPCFRVRVTYHDEPVELSLTKKQEKLVEEVKEDLRVFSEYEPALEDHVYAAKDIFHPGVLADLVASLLPLDVSSSQQVLEEFNPLKRLELIRSYLNERLDVLSIRERIATRVQSELGRAQHKEILREQIRQIQTELGESPEEGELTELQTRVAKKKMPTEAKQEAEKQLRRLQQFHPDASEAALARTYLEWLLELPWTGKSKDRLDLDRARKILDEDHYGLEKTKERILDFLGVRKLRREHRGPVLLLVGPPGVGKTSLGRSIARALGRKFVRVSVGGLRDEHELRGHRRTYVGAMPGRIMQGLSRAGTKNPVFVIDELDKIGSDFRGDPASVLLEVLDPEQNKNFEDHYLNVSFDLSEVMFICTANVIDTVPAPLLDRMEVIDIAGYTTEEKLQIAKRYLIPRELKENGLANFKVNIEDKAVLSLINSYTKESGVRELGREVSAILRKIARGVAEGKAAPKRVTAKHVEKYLGPTKYLPDQRLNADQLGIATGLAWTPVGGEILTVEAAITKGKGALSMTGQLGEVMQESAMAALTYVQSQADELGIDPDFYRRSNVHIHVPQGAIPKDGPSAGVAIATALVSILLDKPISRNVAMTGEIALRGNVLAIGGLKEKALAALRVGIPFVIIPKENERELIEFPKYLLEKVTFVPVENLTEVFKIALVDKKTSEQLQKIGEFRHPLLEKVISPKKSGRTPPRIARLTK